MKRLVIVSIISVIGFGIYKLINRSLPYSNREELLSAEISLDSIWSLGPAATFYDKKSHTSYWLKSYSSLDQASLDTLKSKQAIIRYMKFFKGPIENRIYRMEVDSIVVFDQVIDLE